MRTHAHCKLSRGTDQVGNAKLWFRSHCRKQLVKRGFKMKDLRFYRALKEYILSGTFTPPCNKKMRKEMRRVSENFIAKDNRLFYTGPNKTYMRLVVCTEEEKRSVLMECHNSGTGNHNGVRGTRDRVIAGYFWPTLMKDVTEWVKCCRRCQLNDPMKTGTPVLHSIKVKAAWEVIGLDLIGPLRETGQKNKYVLTMTDLYTKWVVAEPLQNKTATEVSAAIIKTLYLFGMVKKIITDQGREFVNELNENIFATLKIKHAVSSAYHPQTNGQDERTNQNVKRVLRKYVNESHNDWDIHLPAVVYGINTAKQSSTRHTPYFLFFHRHPHLPEVMNACPMGEDFKIADPEDDLDTRVNEMKILNEKVRSKFM
uniref:Integrase catalytic domain-containing protein n=1 Tax=Astyanax mexicanus TaxID=7994 RepID=A0A3B1J522_ASTMX